MLKALLTKVISYSVHLSKQLKSIYGFFSHFFIIIEIGKMHLWAKPASDGAWSVTRIELEVNKHPNQRLLIKDGPKPELQQSQEQQEQQEQQQ